MMQGVTSNVCKTSESRVRELRLAGLLRSKNSQNCMHGLMREGCRKAIFYATN